MNIFNEIKSFIYIQIEDMKAAGDLPAETDPRAVTVEPPRDPAHGDMATNAAMVLAKSAGRKPRDLAGDIAARLKVHGDIAAVEVAGPGFINLRLKDSAWLAQIPAILAAGAAYGDSGIGGNRAINVEYVSANPTGPLHVGHGRGAVFGDVLARLLDKAGYMVTREYYVNDAGAQVEVLARSAELRYREALGEEIGTIPEGLYPGAYLQEVGAALVERFGTDLADLPETERLSEIRDFAVAHILRIIEDDLAALGIAFDVFASERALVADGKVQAAYDWLAARDLIYEGVLEPPKGKLPEDWEPRPQMLFRATAFGDDVDRPMKKSDGSWTYFASDIAYHRDKHDRGFAEMIDVWGADHGGYVKRMQAAVNAVTEGAGRLDVKLCQLVNLTKGGQPVKMSKRAGTFVTLREVIDEVGADVVRFIMLTRKNDASLDFDLEKAVEQSRDNPVFYVQYAHARACSVRRHAVDMFGPRDLPGPGQGASPDLACLTDPDEIALIRLLAGWPRQVENAAEAHEPHRIAYYLQEVAAAFHGLWNKGRDDMTLRFLQPGDRAASMARLALVEATATVIASGLGVLGVAPVTEM